MNIRFKLIFFLLMLSPNFAYAYLGPGMGIGAIIAFFGIIVSVILAIFGIIYYPIKRFIKYIRKKKEKEKTEKKE